MGEAACFYSLRDLRARARLASPFGLACTCILLALRTGS